jgi:hypothetical protein
MAKKRQWEKGRLGRESGRVEEGERKEGRKDEWYGTRLLRE